VRVSNTESEVFEILTGIALNMCYKHRGNCVTKILSRDSDNNAGSAANGFYWTTNALINK
jgi:hypothetical protein